MAAALAGAPPPPGAREFTCASIASNVAVISARRAYWRRRLSTMRLYSAAIAMAGTYAGGASAKPRRMWLGGTVALMEMPG
jgi:hypothetical protein